MIINHDDNWPAFIQGDKTALEKILTLYYGDLFNYGTKYTTDQEMVKDCIQQLFLGLWERKERLSVNVQVKAYLLASLRRALHRALARQKRFRFLGNGQDFSAYFDFELSVEDQVIATESGRLLARQMAVMIGGLPKRQKEVIYLKFFQDLSRDEIALIMGNSPQTVSNLLQLALQKLRILAKMITLLVMAW